MPQPVPDPQNRRLVALQHHDFRLLWSGQMFSTIGNQMQIITVNWHIAVLLSGQTYDLTLFGRTITLGAEALGLGTLGLVRVLPVFVFSLLGGMMADAVDRRRLLLWTNGLQVLPAIALAYITLSGRVTVPLIYVLTALGAAFSTFEFPARQAIVPNIVPRQHLANAISLMTLLWQIGTVVGPAVAGVMIARLGLGTVYAANAASFGAVFAALLLMRFRGVGAASGEGLGPSAILEGFRFVYREKIIWSTMLLDFVATFFSSARTMLPLVAKDVLRVGAEGYGLLATAQPAGALLAGSVLALGTDIHRQGTVLLVSVAIYGLATALFGVSTIFALSYFFFGLTGAGDTVSTVIRGTLRQVLTPDRLRGRMMGVTLMFAFGGPQLGELEAGLVASAFGVPFAIFTGGVATILATAWIALRFPGLRGFTADMIPQPAAGD